MMLNGKQRRMLSTGGGTHLGEDFDIILVEHILKKLEKKSGSDVSQD